MKVYEDYDLKNFEFWSQGARNRKELSDDQMDRLEAALMDLYPDGIDATALNDLMWFDFDWIKELVGND